MEIRRISRGWIWWSVGGITLIIIFIATINVMVFAQPEIISVKTSKVESRLISSTTLASGEVLPMNEHGVYFDSTKGDPDLKVKEGQTVKKGDELFQYQNNDLSLQLEQNEIAKKRILVQLEQQNEKIKKLKKELKEAKEDDLPSETIDQINTEIDELEYQNRVSNLDYQETEIQINDIEEKHKELVVTSPIAGIIKEINEDVTTNSNVQEPYIYIVSADPYVISGTITEYDFNFLEVGQSVQVKPKSLPDKTLQGKIHSISNLPIKNSEEISTNTENVTLYPFTVVLNDDLKELQIGYHVSLEMDIQAETPTLVIPEESVKIEDGKSFVFTVDKGVAHKKEVVTGASHGNLKEIVSGLKEGETVVTNNIDQLVDNTEVVTDDSAK